MKIRIEGAAELVKKLGEIEGGKWLRNALRAAAIHMRGVVATYPPVRHGENRLLHEHSQMGDRMRAGFFARLKRGEIEVPYRRGMSPGSEALGRSWAARVVGDRAIIGNDASYARLVQDRSVQTVYHNITGWITAQRAVDEEGDEVLAILGSYLQQELSK